MAKFLYKRGQKVALRPNAEYIRQDNLWTSREATITEAYLSRYSEKPWYRIECEEKHGRTYRNSYPEGDLMVVGFNNNLEAKELLSKEW